MSLMTRVDFHRLHLAAAVNAQVTISMPALVHVLCVCPLCPWHTWFHYIYTPVVIHGGDDMASLDPHAEEEMRQHLTQHLHQSAYLRLRGHAHVTVDTTQAAKTTQSMTWFRTPPLDASLVPSGWDTCLVCRMEVTPACCHAVVHPEDTHGAREG